MKKETLIIQGPAPRSFDSIFQQVVTFPSRARDQASLTLAGWKRPPNEQRPADWSANSQNLQPHKIGMHS